MVNEYTMYLLPGVKKKPKHDKDICIAYVKDTTVSSGGGGKIVSRVYISDAESIEESCKELTFAKEDYKLECVPLINPKERNPISFFISGPTGSGKTYYTRDLVLTLLKQPRFKDATVYLLTGARKDDPLYEESFKKYYKVNTAHKDFYNITFDNFTNCIVLFDDITAIEDKNIFSKIMTLQKSMNENCRKNNVAIINIVHSGRDWKRTKYIFEESCYYVLFPLAARTEVYSFLKDKLKMKPDLCTQLTTHKLNPTRSITIYKSYPQYVISDTKVQFI